MKKYHPPKMEIAIFSCDEDTMLTCSGENVGMQFGWNEGTDLPLQ